MVKLKSYQKKFEIDEIKNKSDFNLDHPNFLMVNFGVNSSVFFYKAVL